MNIIEFIEQTKNNVEALQVTEFKSEAVELKVVNDKLKKSIFSDDLSYEVKAKINGKYVKLNTNYLNIELLDILKMKSIEIESNYEDEYIKDNKKLQFKEQKNENIKIAEKIETMLKFNNLRQNHPSIEAIESDYEYYYSEKRIVNTNGVDLLSTKNGYTFYVEAAAKDDNKTITYDDVIYTANEEEIDMESICLQVVENAEKSLQKEKLTSGIYNVIFSSSFTSKMIKNLIILLSKEQVRKKLSCLDNKINKAIANDKVTIIEAADNKALPSYTPFDNEGTLTKEKVIIEEGILKTYLYNNQEAILDNTTSTGNSYGEISARNLYLKAGQKSEEDLIKQLKNGLYITKYQETGGTVLNSTNGQISAQIFGFIVENGKITDSFETCIMTTTIFELLSSIKEVANKIEFKTENVGSPAILVENMSIASN